MSPVRRVLEHHAEQFDEVVAVEVDGQRGIDLHIPGQLLAGARALQDVMVRCRQSLIEAL